MMANFVGFFPIMFVVLVFFLPFLSAFTMPLGNVKQRRLATRVQMSSGPSEIMKDYLNKNHKTDMIEFVKKYTDFSKELKKANSWSTEGYKGSINIEEALVTSVEKDKLEFTVSYTEQGFFGGERRRAAAATLPLPRAAREPAELKAMLLDLSLGAGLAKSTSSLYKMPVGEYSGLPPNMRLNNVPHSTLVRTFFYRATSNAILNAVQDPSVPRKMKMTMLFPETNPEMDTYRVGTMLEMVREMTFTLTGAGYRVKICIQGSMGEGIFTGLPLSLSGTRAIMERMDWNEDGGEEQYGKLGKKIVFGAVGSEFVEKEDDVFIIIAPQSMTGASIHEPLVDHVRAAAGRPVVLINPLLNDRPSSGGKMQVQGRADRIAFAESFAEVFSFRCVYPSRASYYPIVGAVQKAGHLEPYVLYKLEGNDYEPVAAFREPPTGKDMTEFISMKK